MVTFNVRVASFYTYDPDRLCISSFVRRVAIAMRLYGLPFEHKPRRLAIASGLREFNPLSRADACTG